MTKTKNLVGDKGIIFENMVNINKIFKERHQINNYKS